mmetsp:Transcript_31996/g.91810  ORF Transcript_31996/g.91810 Transcript_31996/m.91810 type:complete len:181 (-) Transcript_31996:105-647(-)
MMQAAMLSTLAALLVQQAGASTMVYRKCQGHKCENAEYPLLDWDAESETCHCRAHPCHHDTNEEGQRVVHSCTDDKPFLTFSYTEDKQLQCDCKEAPQAGSVYLSRELCPGHTCEDANNLLDYNEDEGTCVCRKHPCLEDDGKVHGCGDPAFPILSFSYTAEGKLECKCSKEYKAAKDEL